MKILSFDQFRRNVSIEFSLEVDDLSRDTRLVADLDFDSFQLFRLFILVESLAPIDIPEGLDIAALDLGGVYDHYVQSAALADLP